MLWSEVPSIINRNGCFFAGHQTQNSEDNIELGDGGTWPVWCGTSWDGCFYWRTRTQKRHNRIDPWLQANARMMTTLYQEKASGSVWAGVCVWMCLFACACAYVPIWVVRSETQTAKVLTPFWRDSAMSRGALAVVLRGRRTTLRAWLLYPAHLSMQRICNTHETHMQHEHFPCKFQAKWPRRQKSTLSILRLELGLQTSNPARWL